ncbi:amidase [Roseovarius salis]|uniref:amidase n=1 Tax=Roseovarius salis TaxID=3376063 RepID=UPI0037CAC20D
MDESGAPNAVAQAAAIAEGRLTAEALMQSTLERIGAVNGTLNAIVSLRDADELLAAARAADKAGTGGPLHGLPVAIKDLANARGLPTSLGSPVFAGQLAERDDPHVARLRAAGAIVIGKTNTPEFGLGSHTYNPVHGVTVNPYAPDRSCGGSSGGAAVALAAGMLSLADGSDMMGSLRNPAGWCNVYGMRPTWGRVPASGEGELFLHQLSTNGPMARCPADLALMLDVMSGPDARQPLIADYPPCGMPRPGAGGRRIGWLGDWGGALAFEDGILALCESALGVLDGAGARIDAVGPPFARDSLWHAWTTLRSWSVACELGPLLDDPATRDRLKPEAVWEIEKGRALSAAEIDAASRTRSDWFRAALALFDTYDALALPTAQVWPFPAGHDWPRAIEGHAMDSYHRWMEVMIPASLVGLPALAMPAGFGGGGLPMGVQLIGPRGGDKMLLELAEAYDRDTGWPRERPPKLS